MSTTADLAKFIRALASDSLFQRPATHEVRRVQTKWQKRATAACDHLMSRCADPPSAASFTLAAQVMRTWRSTKGKSDKGLAYGVGLFQVNFQQDGAGVLWGHDGWCNSFAFFHPMTKTIFTGEGGRGRGGALQYCSMPGAKNTPTNHPVSPPFSGTLNQLENEWQNVVCDMAVALLKVWRLFFVLGAAEEGRFPRDACQHKVGSTT